MDEIHIIYIVDVNYNEDRAVVKKYIHKTFDNEIDCKAYIYTFFDLFLKDKNYIVIRSMSLLRDEKKESWLCIDSAYPYLKYTNKPAGINSSKIF